MWLPNLDWLTGSFAISIVLTLLTVASALLAFWWQHDKSLKNPRSRKSMIIAGVCIGAGILSIVNAVQQDRESALKDEKITYLAAEVTGYKTAILSQAIRADSKPIHAMFVFHPKGLDYNRDWKEIDFEPDDPSIKLFFRQPILSNADMEIDINTLFRYEIQWRVGQGKEIGGLSVHGSRMEIADRMGFAQYSFNAKCDGMECSTTIDLDGDAVDDNQRNIGSDSVEEEGWFGSVNWNHPDVFAIGLNHDISWADIVRAAGAPFESSWYGKGAYGAIRFKGIDASNRVELEDALRFQDPYFGFEFLSQDKQNPTCLMARLPVSLAFARFVEDKDSMPKSEAVYEMKPGPPAIEIVDCADPGRHIEGTG